MGKTGFLGVAHWYFLRIIFFKLLQINNTWKLSILNSLHAYKIERMKTIAKLTEMHTEVLY